MSSGQTRSGIPVSYRREQSSKHNHSSSQSAGPTNHKQRNLSGNIKSLARNTKPISRKNNSNDIEEENQHLKSELVAHEERLIKMEERLMKLEQEKVENESSLKENVADLEKTKEVAEKNLDIYHKKLLKCNIDPVSLNNLNTDMNIEEINRKSAEAQVAVQKLKETLAGVDLQTSTYLQNIQEMNLKLDVLGKQLNDMSDSAAALQEIT